MLTHPCSHSHCSAEKQTYVQDTSTLKRIHETDTHTFTLPCFKGGFSEMLLVFFLDKILKVVFPPPHPIFTATITTPVDCNCIYLYCFILSWTSFAVCTHLQNQKPRTQGGSQLVERAEAANSVACSQSAGTSVPQETYFTYFSTHIHQLSLLWCVRSSAFIVVAVRITAI